MIRLVRPEAFVPVHGTHHHQRRHLELAREEGIEETALIENGSVLELTRQTLRVRGSVPVGRVYIDGMRPLSEELMEERRAMGAGGLVSLWVSLRGGRLRDYPDVASWGVFESAQRRRIERKLSEHVRGRLKGRRFDSLEEAEDAAIEVARRFLMHNHRRRPLITADADGE